MADIQNASGEKVLVLGASGGIGGEVARQLVQAGWRVQALRRGPPPATALGNGITWMTGDAMRREDVMRAARGCKVIVHAVNPPGYQRWAELVMPMIHNTIAAAVAEQATIVLPGTVYNYGPDAFPVLREDSPQHPLTRKGAIRVELERALEASTTAGARVIVVRSGDFFGAMSRNSWLAQGLITPGREVRTIRVPNDPGVGHAWAYLPDVARTMLALLVRRETLPPFARFHMAGHWDSDGRQLAAAIMRVVERHGGRARTVPFPWWQVRLAEPFVLTLREMREVRYLWRVPIRLDGSRLVALLGEEPRTPLDAAIEASLTSLGCLPPTARAAGHAAATR
jgi:nucleoside-diphosphate-sugar epimerase